MILCEEAGLGIPCVHPDEILLEDVDFECYYDEDMDGLESDPAHQHELHDLRRRFRKLPAEARDALKNAAIDDPALLAGFEASSDVVVLARTAAVAAGARRTVISRSATTSHGST